VAGAVTAFPGPCPACGGVPVRRIVSWLARCPACGLWSSDLGADAGGRLRGDTRAAEERGPAAFGPLRRRTFQRVLDELEQVLPLRGARVLDVGCSHGWFLEAARERGARALGIEPNPALAAEARAGGHDVREGYFPAALAPGERFDAVVMNDVLEHLADTGGALDAARRALAPGGCLVLNLPDSRGLLYRTACALARAGATGPLERLWQAGYRSPHLFYFDARCLRRHVEAHGFAWLRTRRLPAVQVRGLWARLQLDRDVPRWRAALLWAVLAPAAPLLALAPSDILLQLYRRDG
jgi:SAM-dependent methyltransferase